MVQPALGILVWCRDKDRVVLHSDASVTARFARETWNNKKVTFRQEVFYFVQTSLVEVYRFSNRIIIQLMQRHSVL